jgi:hypothetical protein
VRRPAIERGRAGRQREQHHRQRVVRLSPEHEVSHDSASERPAKRAQRAPTDERHDSGDSDGKRHQREQDQVDDELRPRFIAPARRSIEEPVHARPAVVRLPDEVRDAQGGSDVATASGQPHERRMSRRQTMNVAMSRTRTTAIVYFVSRPMPAATPSSGHEPRRSASRSASQRTIIVVSWSSATGWKSRLVPSIPGENPIITAASVCARRAAPSSRATRAPTTTVPALARIVIARKRREQRCRRRELDVAAQQMQACDGVVQLIAVPAVTSRDRELQRALQRDDREHRAGREGGRRLRCGLERHGPPSLEPTRTTLAGNRFPRRLGRRTLCVAPKGRQATLLPTEVRDLPVAGLRETSRGGQR